MHVTHSTLAEWRSTICAIDNGRSKNVRTGLCRAHHFAKHTFWSQTSHHIHLSSPSTERKWKESEIVSQRAQALRTHLDSSFPDAFYLVVSANLLAASKAPMLRCGKFVPMQTSNSSFTHRTTMILLAVPELQMEEDREYSLSLETFGSPIHHPPIFKMFQTLGIWRQLLLFVLVSSPFPIDASEELTQRRLLGSSKNSRSRIM